VLYQQACGCGGSINDHVIAHFLMNVEVKEFKQPVNIWGSYDSKLANYFLNHTFRVQTTRKPCYRKENRAIPP